MPLEADVRTTLAYPEHIQNAVEYKSLSAYDSRWEVKHSVNYSNYMSSFRGNSVHKQLIHLLVKITFDFKRKIQL